MSINDLVLSDLENNVLETSTPPGEPDPVEVNETYVETPDLKREVTDDSEEVTKDLITNDHNFKIITDKAVDVVSMKEVEEEIIAKESISQNDVKFIHSLFPELLNTRVKINQFTHTPTKCNYQYVVAHIRDKIAKEEKNLSLDFKTLVDNVKNDILKVRDYAECGELGKIAKRLEDLQETASAICSNPNSENKFLAIFNNTSFVNVFTSNIETINDLTFDGKDQAYHDRYNQAVNSLQSILALKCFKVFIVSCLSDRPIDELLTDEGRVFLESHDLTLKDIFTCIGSGKAVQWVNDIIDRTDGHVDVVTKLSLPYAGNVEGTILYYKDSTLKLINVNNVVHKFMQEANVFINVVNDIAEILKEL